MKKTISLFLVSIMPCGLACSNEGMGFSPHPAKFDSLRLKPGKPVNEHRIVGKALGYVKSSQNQDGSFGSRGNQCKATALAFIALTRHGHSAGSLKYGKTFAKALEWLRHATPESDEDKLAVVIAISGLYTRSGYRKTDYREYGTRDFKKMQSLLKDINGRKQNVWFDLFVITKIPHEVNTPEWFVNDRVLLKKYQQRESEFQFGTLNDYLDTYLVTAANYWTRGRTWVKHKKALVDSVAGNQQENGSFSALGKDDTVAATALSAMCFSLGYQIAHRFFAPFRKTNIKDKPEEGIEVEVEL